MNIKFLLVLFLALPMFASCDKAADAVGDFDISSMTAETAPAKAAEMFGKLTTGLGSITAENAADKAKGLLPTIAGLSALKEKFSAVMPDMSSLTGVVDGLKAKFAGKDAILSALGPIFEKIKGLVG